MEFMSAFNSEKGIVRKTNQDSLCIKVASTDRGNIAMGVVCDGMGGLTKGELASATVIKAFANWFDNVLPNMLDCLTIETIRISWEYLGEILSSREVKGTEFNINVMNVLTSGSLCEKTQCVHICGFGG